MNRSPHHEHHEYIAVGSLWNFLCLFRREVGGAYRVTSPEMPSMFAVGSTLNDARANAQEDLLICLRSSELLDDPFRDWRDELPIRDE